MTIMNDAPGENVAEKSEIRIDDKKSHKIN